MGPLLSRAASAPVPSLLKSPTAPNAAFAPGLAVPSLARNATHCRQAQRGLFLQPHSALFQGLFGQQHFAYRFVGIQHEVSEILFLFTPIFQPVGWKSPSPCLPCILPIFQGKATCPELQLFWAKPRALLSFPGHRTRLVATSWLY